MEDGATPIFPTLHVLLLLSRPEHPPDGKAFMGRPKKSAVKHIEPEDEVQESPEEEPTVVFEPEEESDGASISKAAAVRDALAKGIDSPEAGIGYLNSVYGIVMTRQTFSSYKAQQKARDAKKQAAAPAKVQPAKRGPKPREALAAPAQSPVVQKANGQADLLDALTAMKPLIAQYGAAKIKQMVDLLG
jgi:hypothetical protein